MPRRPSPGRPAGQYTQAVRLFQLYHLLEASPEGARIDDLARELAVTARSIRRDLKALEMAQIEIESFDAAGERRVRLARTGRTTEPIRMTRYQRYSLAAVRRVFDVLAGTPFHDDLTQVFAKLAPPKGSADATTTGGSPANTPEGVSLTDRFLFIPEAPKNYRKFKDQIYEVYDGVLRSLTLSFQYEGGSTPGLRKLEPYALVLYRNGLYVVGKDVAKKQSRTFAIERMRRVRVLSQAPFVRDPTFDVSKMFDGVFGIIGGTDRHHVVVDFEAKIATYIEEREWHSSQKITRLADGVRCELDVALTEELVAWVLRWGASARVREPAELVDRVRREYESALGQYAGEHPALSTTAAVAPTAVAAPAAAAPPAS
jgi:predicted DNA-binding transcriptional regulator YafY